MVAPPPGPLSLPLPPGVYTYLCALFTWHKARLYLGPCDVLGAVQGGWGGTHTLHKEQSFGMVGRERPAGVMRCSPAAPCRARTRVWQLADSSPG